MEYSEKTDVWSFGITVIEIVTRKSPYKDINRMEIVSSVVKGELLMEFPEHLKIEIKQFLKEKCFAYKPENRAKFKVKSPRNRTR